MEPAFVRSTRVVLPDGTRPATLLLNEGRIAAVRPHGHGASRTGGLEAGDLVVLPGLVDTHVHLNEPGRTEWEGFAHGTRAAAAGGVTTLIDMPLNSQPATVSVEALEAKVRATDGQLHVDVGFWGGVVPGNSAALGPLVERGVLGFKSFLSPSGVDDFPHVDESDLRKALPVLAAMGVPLLVHAEWPALLREAAASSDPASYQTWLDTRPVASEQAAINLLIDLARESGAHVHVVHLSSAAPVTAIRAARASGVAISSETCPHYLTFEAEQIARGATPFKCAPPIRSAREREALWRGLTAGDIDLIASDHSPAPAVLKAGDFMTAWGGIASLQLGLAAVWTGASTRGVPFDRIASWMSSAPARLAGLDQVKGRIAVGQDADLVIWDPDAEQRVDPSALQHRHPITPYAGLSLRGVVHTTILRGRVIFDNNTFSEAAGRMILGRRAASRAPAQAGRGGSA